MGRADLVGVLKTDGHRSMRTLLSHFESDDKTETFDAVVSVVGGNYSVCGRFQGLMECNSDCTQLQNGQARKQVLGTVSCMTKRRNARQPSHCFPASGRGSWKRTRTRTRCSATAPLTGVCGTSGWKNFIRPL